MSDVRLLMPFDDILYRTGITKPYDGDNMEECPICISNDGFTYKSWVELKCGHCFHRHCIDLWLENRQTCPICVQDVENIENIENDDTIISGKEYFKKFFGVFFCAALLVGLIMYFCYYIAYKVYKM